MQTWRAPFSFNHGRELNNGQLAYPRHEIHQPSCLLSPIISRPGATAHLDDLLICEGQATTSTRNSFHVTSIQLDDHTLVHKLHHSGTPLTILDKQEEDFARYIIPFTPQNPANSRSNFGVDGLLSENLNSKYTQYQRPEKSKQLRIRPLTLSLDADCDIMNTVASAPGSPPELTESQSSKSSSSNSRSSPPDHTSAEIINFEDIGLGDGKPCSDNDQQQDDMHQNGVGDVKKFQQQAPYYTTRRPNVSELRKVRSRTQGNNTRFPVHVTLQRGFTTPAHTASINQNSGPGPVSPTRQLTRSSSTMSINHPDLGPSPRSSFGPSSRRGSWQPRKTAKEIEAEFHDSDDELPEDASLYNVPISPFPGDGVSPRSSARGSPERSPIQNPRPLPLEHVKSAPDSPPTRRALTTQTMPRQRLTPRSSSANPSRSSPSSPRMPAGLRNGRTKSWNVAMTELCEDARILTQNLEYHADQQIRSNNSRSWDDKWLPSIPQRSSAPGAIQLPPIQRGALDFMPISKEKEAILSRTRPSWLPPKDPKEEKKHLKEYQRMMAASLEAEKKKENKSKPSQLQEDDVQARLNRIWDFYVDPTTDLTAIDRRVNDLCWRGISPRVRGKVWQRTVGNSLGLTSKTYSKALERVQTIKAKDSQDLSRHEKSMMASFSDIDRDVETAFPDLNLFQRNGPLWQDLKNICEAHTCYRGDVGHLYGIQLLGGLMLLQIPDPADAFILLENCLNYATPLAFQVGDVAMTQRTYHKVLSTLNIKFPQLHDYLTGKSENGGLGFTGEELLEPMFRTIFSNGLNVDHLCRVIDIWIFDGDRTLVKTAVAILGSLQQQILDVDGDLHLKRRNIQEMLGWGPFNRKVKGGYWDLPDSEDIFVEQIAAAGKLDYTGR